MRPFMPFVVLFLFKSSLLFADELRVPDGFKIELFVPVGAPCNICELDGV